MSEESTMTPEAPPAAPATEEKLSQQVEIQDIGPCRKKVKVVVDRKAIDERFAEKYNQLAKESKAQLNGFRPGKAPRSILVRRYKPVVTEEVRNEVLMASLEQLASEQNISPLSPPDLNPESIELPEDGPFTYEFEIEVRPEFDLPEYRGLKLKKPVKTFSKETLRKELRRTLEEYGQLVPKEGTNIVVEEDDTITVNITTSFDGKELNDIKEARLRVQKNLVLQDGIARSFAEKVVGAKVGEQRDFTIELSSQLKNSELQGKTIQGKLTVLDIKSIRLPELTPDFLMNEFGVRNEEQLEELIEVYLQRRLEYLQKQSYRQQILGMIGSANSWELPRDLLIKQSKRAFARRVMEMRSAGISDEQIEAQQQMLSQDVLKNTAAALREHFVLQKIAEIEKIEIVEDDLDREIAEIANREGESPRKVRARMERDDLLEALATDLLERKALDVVLSTAEYEEYEVKDDDTDDASSIADAQATPGEMETPTANSETGN